MAGQGSDKSARGGQRRSGQGPRNSGAQAGAQTGGQNRKPRQNGQGQRPKPGGARRNHGSGSRPGGARAGTVAKGTKPAKTIDLAPPPSAKEAAPFPKEAARAAPVAGGVESSGRGRALLIALAPAAVLAVVVLVVLSALGIPVAGLILGVVLGAAVFASIWFGSQRVLLSRLGGGFVDEDDVPRAANLVDGLCATMGLPFPRMVLLDDPFRGALALGTNESNATLVLTTGLLRALDPVELEGVLAHELSHVKSGDMATATVAAAVVLPLAPLMSGSPDLVRRLAGAGRELDADQRASAVTRYPPGLRDALVKMTAGPKAMAPSSLAATSTERVLRWIWTVVPELVATNATGVLDAPATRVAALDEA